MLRSHTRTLSRHACNTLPFGGKYAPSPGPFIPPTRRKRDVIVIGGGHNGLVAAAYLAKSGLDVLVLERREMVGGAAVTEEIVPGFKFSRASYLAGLLRPQIIDELELERFGFKYLPRDPSSFTPTLLDSPWGGKSLVLGENEVETHGSIAQFSQKDAVAFEEYESFLNEVRSLVSPLLDMAPPTSASVSFDDIPQLVKLVKAGIEHKSTVIPFYELFTAPATHILDRWFESDILKATLATDAVVGAMTSPNNAGSAYVLLHHVMGSAAGKDGVWAYIEGGMGAISESIAKSARSCGAEIITNATVARVLQQSSQDGIGTEAIGVEMVDGSVMYADTIVSGCTPQHTFLELLDDESKCILPDQFKHHVEHIDYSCGSFKINCALNELPNFQCTTTPQGIVGPEHIGTIHFNSTMAEIDNAYRQASAGYPADTPVVEMTLPSAVDTTLAPPGQHVAQLFIQFAPYTLDASVGVWDDPKVKERFVKRVLALVEQFCPGFSASIVGKPDALSPLDLQYVFGLEQGSITHGALALHQLGYTRPVPGYSDYRTPVMNLYLCGSGAHPGGGVSGAPGRNCAHAVLKNSSKNLR